ncbi:hypothetical protein [Priestia megaterium]|uniref:hypothetical protein n=1 Tax=Priestia megaterium TaxID=1404 RepID=UPI002DB71A03|nr:hypothetical protein [Priestia megaterium]MEC1071407.1 hypothetical protein [Priestia megaterium]
MLPCLNKNSIKNLYNTADERYNFSPGFFRETHYPQVLNKYYKNELIEKVTEAQLLDEIEEEHLYGNRVYVIFGSTGSGKSELLCWIKDQWEFKRNSRPIVRISRSELNPQMLVKKCYESFGLDIEDIVIDEKKWDLLISKPISIINQMVWTAVSELFDNDDEIVPITMLLRPAIEKNILKFSNQIKKGKLSEPLEIISEQEFLQLMENTTLPIQINYDKLRDSLLKKLDHFLFQGTDIITIFKRLSSMLKEQEIRPVILIDDLVQSLNLYSAEVLDYFITLEEGNWDVIIGLTPGVIEDNKFENILKNRIKTLDTIDDRVKKLWLSDESGTNSFSIDRNQACNYLENYLTALKKANGFECSSKCKHASTCTNILVDSKARLTELPLNQPLIQRVYDAIPDGKGLLRYMVIHLRELLLFFLRRNKKDTDKIKHFFYRDIYAEHEDSLIKIIAEMYADSESRNINLPRELIKNFNSNFDKDITVKLAGISMLTNSQSIKETVSKTTPRLNPIRDWVDGQNVNEQLLEPIRAGVASIISEVVKGTSFGREYVPRMTKSTSIIQRTEVTNRFKYPITFKENNKRNQVFVKKHFNLLNIANYQQLKIQDRPLIFSEVANDHNVAQWIYQGEQIKEQWHMEITQELGMNLEHFAYQFKKYITKLGKIGEINWISQIESPVSPEILESVEFLFLDWFSLRDNMIDYYKLELMKEDLYFEKWLLDLNPSKSLNKYSLKNIPLQTFILNLQANIKTYYYEVNLIIEEKIQQMKSLKNFIKTHSNEFYEKLEGIINTGPTNRLSLEFLLTFNDIDIWFSNYHEQYFQDWQKQQILEQNINNILVFLKEDDDLTDNIASIDEFQHYLVNKLNIRKQVSHHLTNLIQHGHTQLPKKQWKGILNDLDEHSPHLFKNISVQISIRK